jgi:hypothetical protein
LFRSLQSIAVTRNFGAMLHAALSHRGARKAFSAPGNNPFDIRLDRRFSEE